MADESIYIVDQITAKPGMGRIFLDAYMQRYAAGAKERGMTLEHTWVAPPVWLEDQSNTLFIVWSVKGAKGVWDSLISSRRVPSVDDWWWKEAAPMIAARERYFLSNPSDIASLTDV
jgi:L-rhamnose mutarotase